MQMQLTAEQWQTQRWEREVEQRNRALSDEELDSMMPTEGYKVLEAPPGYAPIRTPARKLMATPTPMGGTPMYQIPEEDHQQKFDVPIEMEGLPEMKPEDQQYFGKLLKVFLSHPCMLPGIIALLLTPYICACVGFRRCARCSALPCCDTQLAAHCNPAAKMHMVSMQIMWLQESVAASVFVAMSVKVDMSCDSKCPSSYRPVDVSC